MASAILMESLSLLFFALAENSWYFSWYLMSLSRVRFALLLRRILGVIADEVDEEIVLVLIISVEFCDLD